MELKKIEEKINERMNNKELFEMKNLLFEMQFEDGMLIHDNVKINKILDLEEKVENLIHERSVV